MPPTNKVHALKKANICRKSHVFLKAGWQPSISNNPQVQTTLWQKSAVQLIYDVNHSLGLICGDSVRGCMKESTRFCSTLALCQMHKKKELKIRNWSAFLISLVSECKLSQSGQNLFLRHLLYCYVNYNTFTTIWNNRKLIIVKCHRLLSFYDISIDASC